MEILTDLQRKVLLQFSGLPDQEAFYLTGGTALSAIFLKHRRSHDLDFFTHTEELIQPVSQKLEASLIKEGLKVKRSRAFHSFVELSVSYENESTVVHFALDSPFRFEEPSKVDEIFGVKVDSLIDIATNKLLALSPSPCSSMFNERTQRVFRSMEKGDFKGDYWKGLGFVIP